MNLELVKQWLNYKSLSDEELQLIRKPLRSYMNYDIYPTAEYLQVSKNLQKLIPNFYNSSFDLQLAPTATDLINELFKQEVDDDTLVITSEREHPSVIKARSKCKNVFIANYNDYFVNQKLKDLPTNCKKVFLYIISTQVGTGEITPSSSITKIASFYRHRNIPVVICLDDCQGLFCINRDYCIFDYVLFTAHSLFKGVNQGMLFSRSKEIGLYNEEIISKIYEKFQLIDDKKDKILLFKNVMTQTFFDFINKNNCKLNYDYNNFNGIFSFEIPSEFATKELQDWLMPSYAYLDYDFESNADKAYIRFRAQQFITHPDKLLEAIEKVENLFEGGF